MKSLNLLFSIFLCAFLFCACSKDEVSFSAEFHEIPSDKYNESDIFDAAQSGINQTWKAISAEQSGINGPIPVQLDFEFLLIKPNGIFGINKSDELITYGEIIIVENSNNELIVKFEPEEDPDMLNIEVLKYNNIRLQLESANELRLFYGGVKMVFEKES